MPRLSLAIQHDLHQWSGPHGSTLRPISNGVENNDPHDGHETALTGELKPNRNVSTEPWIVFLLQI